MLLNKALVSSSIFLSRYTAHAILSIAASRLFSDFKYRLTDPAAMAAGALSRAMEFIFVKGEPTFSTFRRRNDDAILKVL